MTVFSLFIRADRFQYPSTRLGIVTQTNPPDASVEVLNRTNQKCQWHFRDINADDNTIPIYNEENGKNLYRLVKPLVSLPIMHTTYRCYENKVIGKH